MIINLALIFSGIIIGFGASLINFALKTYNVGYVTCGDDEDEKCMFTLEVPSEEFSKAKRVFFDVRRVKNKSFNEKC